MGAFASALELGIKVGNNSPSDLARWQSLLQEASDLIRTHRGQMISFVEGDTVTFGATNDHRLFLPETPITAITSVTVDGVLQAASTYDFTSWALFHPDGSTWPNGATVIYSHGYLETSPEFGEYKSLAIRMVQRALFGPQGEVFGPERVEAVGWSAQIYLTEEEQIRIGGVAVG